MLDPKTPIGKIRLRIGDWGDIPILPDSVIVSALEDSEYHLPSTAKLCAGYVLAVLSQRTHKRALQVEVWGAEAFTNYLKFIHTILVDPNISDIAPIPYAPTAKNEILKFMDEWKRQDGIRACTGY